MLCTEMIDELGAASKLLDTALENYLTVCSTIQATCNAQGDQFNVLQELSKRVAKELLLVDCYEAKLKQAKTAISLLRGSFTGIIPINTLPDEILVRIFYLVLDTQCYIKGTRILFPKYPDLLSHVCSRWRDIAISSCALWSRIDLAPCHVNGSNLLARGMVCAARARHLPLYLRVTHLRLHVDYSDHNRNALEEFLTSVAARIKSLELVIKYIWPEDDPELASEVSILESCIGKCAPGTLTQLIMTNKSFDFFNFVKADGHESPAPNTALRLSREFLEDLWRPIMVLQLNGVYPYWSSAAYHRLSELRLTSYGDSNVAISESQLVSILMSSPGLRIFQFDCDMTDPRPIGASVAPVQLDYLEVVSVSGMHYDQLGSILRWLAPGSTPLQVSITDSYQTDPLVSVDGVKKFLARSNITKLHYGTRLVTAPSTLAASNGSSRATRSGRLSFGSARLPKKMKPIP